MAFGYNSNAAYNGTSYHVQTEDRGVDHPFIDTTVYCRGRVLHRRTYSYYDLLPLSPECQETLGRRVDAQHRAVVEEIRSGALRLTPPPEQPATLAASKAPPSVAARREIQVELMNAKNWLVGHQARLEVTVREKATQAAVSGARITARIEGAAVPSEFFAQTASDGRAMLTFPMPKLGGGEVALAIQAQQGSDRAQVRFQLRAKPKTVSPAGAR